MLSLLLLIQFFHLYQYRFVNINFILKVIIVYFLAQISPDLAIGRSFKLIPVSFFKMPVSVFSLVT